MKVKITKLPKASTGGLSDFMSKSAKYKNDASFTGRKALAAKLGIKDYSGTASQNTQMLSMLQNKTAAQPSGKNIPKVPIKYKSFPGSIEDFMDRHPVSADQAAYNKAAREDEPKAGLDNVIRKVLPLPKNAGSYAMKKVLDRNRMNTSSLTADEKDVMYQVIQNAAKRTGKQQGGTEYEDYKGVVSDEVYAEIMKAKSGKINKTKGFLLGVGSPGYDMATTVGRGTYAIEPGTGNVSYSDSYDFKNSFTQDAKTGKLKEGYMKEKTGDSDVDSYRESRRIAAEEDQVINVPENRRIKFNLTRADLKTKDFKIGGINQKGYAMDDYKNGYINPLKSAVKPSLNSFIGKVSRENANIEAEAGETVMGDFNQDGNLEHLKIGGERHSNGGTPLNVPKGAFIFSDTAKMKIGGEILTNFGKTEKTKKKFTPAQLAKQYDLNFYQEKLKNEGDDVYARNTAELMKTNNETKLATLAFVQEAMKGFPSGIPGVAQEILQEGQEEPQMRFGGVPKFQAGGYQPWPGDKYENKGNASKYTAKQISEKAKALGYTGAEDNLSLQKWINDQEGLSNDAVDKLHQQYLPMPHGGKIDGKWGYRWDTALDTFKGKMPFNPQKIRVPGQPGATIDPNYRPFIGGNRIPAVPQMPENNSDNIRPNDFNPTAGDTTSIGPNAWDVMGTLRAATRPIDHIRPQLLRADAQVSDPTFMDNRAQVQQMQSVAAGNNGVVQNTASGQIARSNIMGNTGRLFDSINQSNGDTNNQNVSISNNWKASRDQVMNQNTISNLGALSKFISENDMYRANLSKEKQLKFTDTIQQGQNMTNNMLTMGSILERTPNMTMKGPFWNPSFGRGESLGAYGSNEESGNSQSQQAAMYDMIQKKYPNMSPTEVIAFMKMSDVKRTLKKDRNGRVISSTEQD